MQSFEDLSHLSVRERAALGLRGGARLGAYFAVASAAVGLFLGRVEGEAPAVIPLAVGVLVGFLIAGTIFKLLRPWACDTPRAALLGATCMVPVLFAVVIALRGFGAVSLSAGVGVLGVALPVGGLLGLMAWKGWTRTTSE